MRVENAESGGLSPLVLVVHAGAFGTRRARPIRFVVAYEWKVKESVGADLRAARNRDQTKSRCGAVAGGRGRPPLPVGTLRAGFAVKCERMRPFARRGNESTSNGIEANVFPFLRVMRRVTDASVEEVALEANVMCL